MNEVQVNDYWAEVAQKSGLFPDKTNVFQIKAVIEIGRSIGMPPFQSLKHISFIKGKINMEVVAQLALFKKAGGRVLKIEATPERAYIELEFQGITYTSEFTIKDAEKMGVIRQGGGYEKYPATMLTWRAIGNKLKFIVPDLLMGLYASDELASFIDEVKEVEVERQEDDEFIMSEILKDYSITEQLRLLHYSRREAINIYKDFNGNLDKISEVLNNEIKKEGGENEVDI